MKKALSATIIGALLVWVGVSGGSPEGETAGFLSNAKYATEEEAIRRGEEIGLGAATWEAPEVAKVNSHVQWKIRFTVGPAGIKTGGAIRLATAHDFRWDLWGGARLQTADPRAENYVTFRTSTGAALAWTYYGVGGERHPVGSYHPWQNMNEFRLAGAALKEGGLDRGCSRGA